MAKSIADQLMERRAALIEKAQEVAQRGVVEGRDLTVEEQSSFDQMIAEADKIHERAKAIHEGEQRGQDLARSFKEVTGKDFKPGEEEGRTELSKFGEWARNARYGDAYDMRAEKGAEQRAVARVISGEARALSATGGVGSDSVYGLLWEYAVAASQILQSGCQVINTSDGNPLPFPVATAHSQTSDTPVAANGALPSSDATLTTVQNTVSKYAYITVVPSELVQDTTFDLEGYIARSAGRELARRLGKVASASAQSGYTILGSGNGASGYGTSLGNQATVGQGTDLLIALFHSVLPEYRAMGSGWLMADPTAALVRSLKGTTGETVWQPALTAGDPDLILGKPVFIDPNLPTAALGAKTIYFGDWSSMVMRIAGGIRFERSNDYAFGDDQIAFRAIVRCGASVLDPNAVKYFQHSAAA